MKTKKVLSAKGITLIQMERAISAREELYKEILNTIKKFKKKKQPLYFMSDADVNNILAKLIKDSTDLDLI